MPTVTKVTTLDKPKKAKGRPKGSKNVVKVATPPSYTWICSCGKKQVVFVRCYDVQCSCKKSMTCTRKAGVL